MNENLINNQPIDEIPLVDNFCNSGQTSEARVLPIDGLPKVARDIIMYYAKTLQCPQDYLTASVLAAISLAIGRHYFICEGSFEEYANLYVALVGDAGAGKSTPINKIFIPMEAIERISMSKYEKQLDEEQSKPVDQRNKVHAVEYILRNSTPEATTEALKYNPKGLYQYSDELSSFLTGRGMYNGNFDSGELNTLYDAKCSIKRSRKKTASSNAPEAVKAAVAAAEEATGGETYAAIAMALHLFREENDTHDEESFVVTLNHTDRTYSPWSSKIYSLRQLPQINRK